MRTLCFTQITDARFNNDIENLLIDRVNLIRDKLSVLDGVNVKTDAFDHFDFGDSDQYRCNFYVSKTGRQTTWDDIYAAVNSVKAVPYTFRNDINFEDIIDVSPERKSPERLLDKYEWGFDVDEENPDVLTGCIEAGVESFGFDYDMNSDEFSFHDVVGQCVKPEDVIPDLNRVVNELLEELRGSSEYEDFQNGIDEWEDEQEEEWEEEWEEECSLDDMIKDAESSIEKTSTSKNTLSKDER